jgi:hypothetical protein
MKYPICIVLRRNKYYTLINISPRHSLATYFDSGSLVKKKYYNNIKSVLDDALDGYALKGGIFAKGQKKSRKASTSLPM